MMLLQDSKYLYPQWWMEVLHSRYRIYKNAAFFRPKIIEKYIEDVHCRFFIGNPTGQAWYGSKHEHTSLEMRFVRDHMLKPGMCVFEVGGHHGHDTIVLSKWVGPKGQVFVFEPVPENAAIIRENCRLNELDNVELVQIALGDQVKKIYITKRSNGKVMTSNYDSGLEVDMTTLDAFCQKRGVWPDLVKIDVEGYEIAVLQGAHEIIAAGAELLVELHTYLLSEFGHRASDLWGLVDRHRYDVWLQRDDLVAPQPMLGDAIPNGRPHVFCVSKSQNG